MDSEKREPPRLAVLIDAENIGARLIEPLLSKVAKLGRVTVKRIYGDWTLPRAAQWRAVSLDRGLEPIQQFRITKGKNRVDSALIIDAMDLLYTGRFDGFCIVSSDGDFTRLASRLRESGPLVYGFGEKTAPDAFRTSCDRFFVLEPPDSDPAPAASTNGAALLPFDATHRAMVRAAYLATESEDGWVDMGFFGSQLHKLSPSFNIRAFGHAKLGGFVESIGLFEVKKISNEKAPATATWRIKWVGK